jgi:Pentapeptide repeats (8 copies)
MDTQTGVSPAAPSGSSTPDLDSISDQMKQVRAAASALLNKAEGSSSVTDLAVAVEKAAGALKMAAEMEKTRSELVKLTTETSKLQHENETAVKRASSERMRDYVALLTPLVTIVILAATLVAQNWQFLRSERDKREDAMDAQWQDAVKMISASGALSPGVIALQPFLRSTKYGDQAREAAVNLLANSSDPSFFISLFGTALAPVTWTNLDRIVRLDRALVPRAYPVWTKTFNAEKEAEDTKGLSKEELATYTYVDGAFPVITSQVGGVLKTPRPAGAHTDFSATFFKNGDWQGISLSGLNLENARLIWTSLQNAELEGLTQFSGADLSRTTWWEAKSINRPLLEYLKVQSPFKPGIPYGPRNVIIQQPEYDKAIQRLMSQLK